VTGQSFVFQTVPLRIFVHRINSRQSGDSGNCQSMSSLVSKVEKNSAAAQNQAQQSTDSMRVKSKCNPLESGTNHNPKVVQVNS